VFGHKLAAVDFAAGAGGTLQLDASASFARDAVSIAGFGGNDVLDLQDILHDAAHTTTLAYSPINPGFGGSTSGTLTVSDGTHTASLLLFGQYSASSFVVQGGDGNGGTLIADAHQTAMYAAIVAPH